MYKSAARPIYAQIEELKKQATAIERKEEQEIISMKAIVQFRPTLMGLSEAISHIYFDTFGHYSDLRECSEKSKWTVVTGPESRNPAQLHVDYSILCGGGSICTGTVGPVFICNAVNWRGLFVFRVAMKSKRLYTIQFNPYLLTWDDAIDITSGVIRLYHQHHTPKDAVAPGPD